MYYNFRPSIVLFQSRHGGKSSGVANNSNDPSIQCKCPGVSRDSATASGHARHQDPETETAKCISPSVHFIIVSYRDMSKCLPLHSARESSDCVDRHWLFTPDAVGPHCGEFFNMHKLSEHWMPEMAASLRYLYKAMICSFQTWSCFLRVDKTLLTL